MMALLLNTYESTQLGRQVYHTAPSIPFFEVWPFPASPDISARTATSASLRLRTMYIQWESLSVYQLRTFFNSEE